MSAASAACAHARATLAHVREHPEREPFESEFTADYGWFNSLAELLRRIGLDERQHKDEGLAHRPSPIARARCH